MLERQNTVEVPNTANDNGVPPTDPNVCETNKPAPIIQRYKKARNALNQLDDTLCGLEYGTHALTHKALKAAAYFAIHCHNNPQEAEGLEGWAEIKLKANSNPFLPGIRYAARNVRTRSLDTKYSFWATITQRAYDQKIRESDFLHALSTNGGIDRWYRTITKAAAKRGARAGNGGAGNKGSSPPLGRNGPSIPTNAENAYLSQKVLKAANDGRELVAVVLDITQSHRFSAEGVKAKFRVYDEYVDSIAVANLGEAA